MAEERTVAGGGGILGVNNLQRAIDSFDRSVETLKTVVGTLNQGRQSYNRGRDFASGNWNNKSNWSGAGNGGNPTFGGQPSSSGGNGKGTPNGGGKHRADGAPDLGGVGDLIGGGDGSHRGTNYSGYKTAFTGAALVGGAAAHALSGVNSATNGGANTMSDGKTMLNTGQMMNAGQRMDPRAIGGMFRNSGWAQNTQDAGGALYNNWLNGGSSATRGVLNQSVQQSTMANPTMSAADASRSIVSMTSPVGRASLHTVGITTMKRGGQRMSAVSIANQVLNQVDPHQVVREAKDIDFLVNDPYSNLNLTLGNWVANGLLDGDQVQSVKDNILMILKARASGMGAGALQRTIKDATTQGAGGSATKKLNSMGIGDTLLQKTKNLAASGRNSTAQGLDGFAAGVESSTKALTDFKDTINAIMQVTGLSSATGLLKGARAVGGGPLGTIAGVAGALGVPMPFGGNTENRMSITAGGTMSAVGSGGAGMTSGTPHNSGMAAAGGMAVGGGSGPSASGKSAASKGGQKMTWPCRGPITCKFGTPGRHWASGHHTGTDIGVGTGTPIHAAASGTVQVAGWFGSYGIGIEINHGGGIQTIYGHNSRAVVKRGQHVRQGQLIAYSGATGNVTGPHCHFEVRKNGHAVDPMHYLSGGATVPGSAGGGSSSGGGGSAAGVGASAGGSALDAGSALLVDSGLGSGASMSGGGGGGSGVGTNELDALMGGGSAGGGGGGGGLSMVPLGAAGTTTTGGGGSSGGPVSGGAGSAPKTTPGGTTSGLAGNKAIVNRVASHYGWGKGAEWTALVNLVNSESGFRNTVKNPHSTAYGMFQFLDSTWKGYGPKTSNPTKQAEYGLKYVHSRYGDPIKAWSFHKSHNWYDKGAWSLPNDETARVHKDEMIIPAAPARQIREILVNGNPYGATSKKGGGAGGVTLDFKQGAIQISVQGGDGSISTGQALGKAFVDQLMTDQRIKNLQNGGKK